MINRILIRITVVQLLYSYLLTRSEFRIVTAPEKSTADGKYAHTLYLRILLMILELAGYKAGLFTHLPAHGADSHLVCRLLL